MEYPYNLAEAKSQKYAQNWFELVKKFDHF